MTRPGPHGGDGARVAADRGVPVDAVLDLSASLNPTAPDIVSAAARHLQELTRYPDDRFATRALADAMQVDPDRLVLTNGGAEAIALVAARYPSGCVDSFEFSLYARHLRHVRSDAPRWRSDPHNPTGVLAPRDDRSFVRDEAFYPLTGAGWTRGDPDTIVVGSLTKLFACPGLRAGYIVARDPDEAAALAASRPEWTVNGLACAVIPDLLAATDLAVMAREVRALRQRLEALLTRHGLAPTAGSAANYVWIDRAPGLRARLLPHLIVLRDGGSFGRPDAVRIAVPDAAGLDRLAVALDHITERSEA